MSYSTLEEAQNYLDTHYVSTDPAKLRWESLSANDQQALLNMSESLIDALPLTGRTYALYQPNAFPRYPELTVPDKVKHAEVELALAYSDTDATNEMREYKKMVDYGITSYSIGKFSESFLSYGKNSLQLRYGLISPQAEKLLSPWLSGGFCFE